MSQWTRSGYDAVAAQYADQVGQELAGKPFDRALLTSMVELCAGGPLLDLGAGPGHVGRFLRDAGAEVISCDLSPAMCALAAQEMPSVAADLTALPLRTGVAGAIVCLYAVIHLDDDQRATAYGEMARVLRPGGHALVSFHTSDAESAPGTARAMTQWWGRAVQLTFRFLDPAQEVATARRAGLDLVARLDRTSHAGVEHPSERSYLVLRRPA